MRASYSEIVARIERGLLGEAPHEVVHSADPWGVFVGLVDFIECKFVLDRRILLDDPLTELGLPPAICVFWIFLVDLFAVQSDRRWWARRQWTGSPVVGPCFLEPRRRRRRHDALLKSLVFVIAGLLRADGMDSRHHDDLVGRGSCITSPGVNSGRAVSERETMRCPSQGLSRLPA
jgi:hypothetical protein